MWNELRERDEERDAGGDGGGLLPLDLGENSRRGFIASSATALGALALGSAAVGGQDEGGEPANATEPGGDDDAAEDDDAADDGATESPFEDDAAILNYALTLEHVQVAFYEAALEALEERELLAEAPTMGLQAALGTHVSEVLRTLRRHEQTHVDALTGAIEDRGADPVAAPETNFERALEHPKAFLGTAAELEGTATAAYAGAAPYVEDPDLLRTALGIHSVEARHAAVMRTLSGRMPWSGPIDDGLSREEVLDRLSPYLVDDQLATE